MSDKTKKEIHDYIEQMINYAEFPENGEDWRDSFLPDGTKMRLYTDGRVLLFPVKPINYISTTVRLDKKEGGSK